MRLDRRALIAAAPAVFLTAWVARSAQETDGRPQRQTEPQPNTGAPSWPDRLVAAAEAQVGVTTVYDPAYVRLVYPGGDVAPERGVCTDVVVRAYRAAFALDLQRLVHEDMASDFSAYPKSWRARGPDANIDHRRVPNLEAFLRRRRAELPASEIGSDYLPGDLVTQRLPGALPHIAIVSARRSDDGSRPLLIHNIGAGARIEDTLFAYRIAGRFRFPPPVRAI